MNSIGKLVVTLLIIGVVVGGIAYYFFNKKVEGLESAKAAYELTADQLFDEFELNEVDANQKYEGEVLIISGKVVDIKEGEKQYNITLGAENAMIGGVNCSFSKKPEIVEVGDQVKIKGRCQGFLMDVVLNNCLVVDDE